ncbi:glycosyltransferase family 4 protein [Rhizobium sp. C1]|nr:glycosyltransferase family 4 protein [Rhizobium sp. C1]MCD2177247.1 glycosyltransferase family 4 protein [Rhizobium sp. C1]
MRIIHCFRSPVGGIFRHVRDLAVEHSRAGHEVGIVCDSITGGAYEDALFDQIRPYLALGLTRIPINRAISPSDFGAFMKSYQQIRSLQPDVLHGHGAKGGAIARVIGSLLRVNRYCVARIYSPHGGSLHFRPGVPGSTVFMLERILERMGDATVFVCEFERNAYLEKIGRPARRTVVNYNGIDSAEFISPGLVEEPRDFEYIGMMRDLKGGDLFIRAFAEAERIVGHPMSALMIGDGPDQHKYADLMVQLGLGKRITMLPAMKQREAFRMARTLVVPSRAEAMPYVVLEAVAAGKPIIATRVGGIPEALGARNPALTPPDDWESLAQVMARAATEPDWFKTTQPDMDTFESTFSSRAMGQRMIELYHSIQDEVCGRH